MADTVISQCELWTDNVEPRKEEKLYKFVSERELGMVAESSAPYGKNNEKAKSQWKIPLRLSLRRKLEYDGKMRRHSPKMPSKPAAKFKKVTGRKCRHSQNIENHDGKKCRHISKVTAKSAVISHYQGFQGLRP